MFTSTTGVYWRYQDAITTGLVGWSALAGSLDLASGAFTSVLNGAMKVSCPYGACPAPKAWLTAACGVAMSEMKRRQRAFRARPDDATREAYEAARDAADQCYSKEKERSWREFAGSLNPNEPSSKVWGVIRSMDGRSRQSLPDRPLSKADGAALVHDGAKVEVAVTQNRRASDLPPRAASLGPGPTSRTPPQLSSPATSSPSPASATLSESSGVPGTRVLMGTRKLIGPLPPEPSSPRPPSPSPTAPPSPPSPDG